VAARRALSRVAYISRISKCQYGCDSRKGRARSVLYRPEQVALGGGLASPPPGEVLLKNEGRPSKQSVVGAQEIRLYS
jgi:hypothetical protein